MNWLRPLYASDSLYGKLQSPKQGVAMEVVPCSTDCLLVPEEAVLAFEITPTPEEFRALCNKQTHWLHAFCIPGTRRYPGGLGHVTRPYPPMYLGMDQRMVDACKFASPDEAATWVKEKLLAYV